MALAMALALAAGAAVACDDDGIDIEDGVTEIAEEVTEITDGDDTPAAGGAEDGERIELVAEDIAFDTDEITVAAGSRVTVELTNEDAEQHNFAVYESEDASEEIFVGEIFSGPDETRTEMFDAPEEPGTYFFRCDVHPTEMTGDFIVE
jgi:plastocyanin